MEAHKLESFKFFHGLVTTELENKFSGIIFFGTQSKGVELCFKRPTYRRFNVAWNASTESISVALASLDDCIHSLIFASIPMTSW